MWFMHLMTMGQYYTTISFCLSNFITEKKKTLRNISYTMIYNWQFAWQFSKASLFWMQLIWSVLKSVRYLTKVSECTIGMKMRETCSKMRILEISRWRGVWRKNQHSKCFLPKGKQKFPFTGKNYFFSNREKFGVSFSSKIIQWATVHDN